MRPGDLLGLPQILAPFGAPLAALRYAALLAVVLWVLLALRTSPRRSLVGGVLLAWLVFGFWIAALGRPYGLLVHADATLAAVEASVGARGAAGDDGALVGQAATGRWLSLGRAGLPPRLIASGPTLLPLVTVPALVAVVALLAPAGPAAATVWLLAGSGSGDILDGAGFVSGLWTHPGSSLALVALMLLALGAGRAPKLVRLGFVLLLLVTAIACFRGAPPTVIQAVRLLTVDQGLWLLVGLAGMRSNPGAGTLAASGAALLLLGALGLPVDPWGPHALYRAGLLVAAAGPLQAAFLRLAEWGKRRRAWAIPEERLAMAALIVLLAPASALVWWNPLRLDPVADASVEPISPVVLEATGWIARHTPSGAVIMAGPEYAPAVGALAGRRVLRAPTLLAAVDETPRVHAEKHLLAGTSQRLADRFGVTHVLLSRNAFPERGVVQIEDLRGRPGFREVWTDGRFFSVYEVVRQADGGRPVE